MVCGGFWRVIEEENSWTEVSTNWICTSYCADYSWPKWSYNVIYRQMHCTLMVYGLQECVNQSWGFYMKYSWSGKLTTYTWVCPKWVHYPKWYVFFFLRENHDQHWSPIIYGGFHGGYPWVFLWFSYVFIRGNTTKPRNRTAWTAWTTNLGLGRSNRPRREQISTAARNRISM